MGNPFKTILIHSVTVLSVMFGFAGGSNLLIAGEVLEFEKGKNTLTISLSESDEKNLKVEDIVSVILKRNSRKLKGRILVVKKTKEKRIVVIAADDSVRAFKPESIVEVRKFDKDLDQILVYGSSGIVRNRLKFGLGLKLATGNSFRDEFVGGTAFLNLNENLQLGIGHSERRFGKSRKTISDVYIRVFPFNVFHVTVIGARRLMNDGFYFGRDRGNYVAATKESYLAGFTFGNQWAFSTGIYIGIDWLTGMRSYATRIHTRNENELSEEGQQSLHTYKKRDTVEVHTGTLMVGAMF